MQGKGWLLAGIAGALIVALVPAYAWPPGARWPLVALALAVGCALYFRSHWAATDRSLRDTSRQSADVSERLERLADDLDRSAFVIRDNLEEVRAARSSLFLDGARAHASKLADLSARCRGLASRLPSARPRTRSGDSEQESGRDDG